ncbi:site-2 protease family protein [Streptomyces luteocolor]|uniref:site-2 protease family protein n=1 Tax=Streptomyces luteocolor TaxID=285500 RepID=UPI000853B2D5|nr:site-2 protease family protein [Streptomyces luteocolor]
MDESGGSGKPRSDGAEDRRPDDADASQEPTRPVGTAQEPTRPVDAAQEPARPADGPATDTPPEPERPAASQDARRTAADGDAERTEAPRGDTAPEPTGAAEPTQPSAERPEPADAPVRAPATTDPAPPRTTLTKAPRQDPPAEPHRARATHGPTDPAGSGSPTGSTGPTRPTGPSGKESLTPPKAQKGPGGGLLMGRPFGVPVYVAPSWFLVAALITWVFGDQLDRVLPELGGARYLVSLFFAVAFYASVLVHELAHTVAALRFKLPVRRIQLQFFGGVSEIEKESETPGREFVLAFVGPLLSLVLAGVFYAGMRAVEPGTVPGVLLAGLMISNLIVAVFNLLPGLPLDGGRMLRAVVWKITGKPMSGTIAAAWVGRALAVSVLIGLPLLNQSGALGGEPQDIGGMDTVTDALLAAILAAIIWTGAGNSLRMARLREHLPELRARTLTRRAVPVEGDTPLSEALRRANEAGARALVVVDPDGDPLAVVREAAIVSVPQHRRPWVTVDGLAQDITEGMRVSAELAGEELLDTLRATPATEYLVVEESGEIYGVLSAADVERAFVKAMARPA